MMDPNKTDLATQVTAVDKDAIIGCVYRNECTDEKVFVIMNVAWGNARSSCAGAKSLLYREACVNRWKNSVMLEEVLSACSAVMVASPSEADVDLSVDGLKRDTFTRLFS